MSATTLTLADLLAVVRPLAEEAGRATLTFYGDTAGAREKADGSPVTLADQAAEDVILPALRALTPDIPVVSEEEVAQGRRPRRASASASGLSIPWTGQRNSSAAMANLPSISL